MANMSYCRFENTYIDLLECQEALSGGIEAAEADAGEYEKPYIQRLIDLCAEITETFSECDDE